MDYDAEVRLHNEVLRRALDVQADERVLDIGCGSGQITREAARMAQAGGALGVDISATAIERARELAQAQEIRNVTFECADAQAYRFPQARFDLAISRFGTMFFDDPGAAFENVGRSRLDPAAAACALGPLREMPAAHVSGDGVWFGSRAWIVTARRI